MPTTVVSDSTTTITRSKMDAALTALTKNEAENNKTTLINSDVLPEVLPSLQKRPSLQRRPKNKDPPSDYITTTRAPARKRSKLTQSTLSFPPTKKVSSNVNKQSTTTSNLNTFACLRNLGSTCYINVIIQVMRYTPGFVASIHRLNKQIDYLESLNIELENEISTNNNAKFVKNLHQLLVEMTEKEKQDRRPIYSPVKFVKTVWTLLTFWSNGSQQDAHEFLQYTIHFINECDLFIRKIQHKHQIKPNSMNVDDIFVQNNEENGSKKGLLVTSKQQITPKSFTSSPPVPRKTKNSLKTGNLINDNIKSQVETKNLILIDEKNNLINEQLSERLVKSIPQIKKSIKPLANDNILRTPTKGGASSYNSSTSNPNSAKTQPITKNIKIEPFMSSPPKIKTPNNKKIIKKNEDLYSFSDSTDNFNIFMRKCEKSTLIKNKKEIINNVYDFDLNEPLVKNNVDLKNKLPIIDEKDIVSKKLKETISKNEVLTTRKNQIKNTGIRRSMSSTDFEFVQNNIKRLKRENGIKSPNSLNDSLNSIMIYDSENEEDVYFNLKQEKTIPIPISIQKNKKFKAAPKSPICIKKSFVLLDNIKNNKVIERITSENKDITFDCLSTLNKNDSPISKSAKRSKIKEKTLAITPIIKDEYTGSIYNGSLVDLNAITNMNPIVKPTNVMNNNGIHSTNPITNFRSKLRSRSETVSSTKTPEIHHAPSLSICSVLPPSPAELLRKYKDSSSSGYTCEMDKLFKGSSVTVTQCLECENLRKCPEAFYDRSIPNFDTNYDDEDQNGVNWITKCLSNESYLNDNSKYMCDKCQSKQEAKIHTQYTQMPNILILHLLSYGITSSIDGNLNAQKLSNRSRLVDYFECISTPDLIPQEINTSKNHDWMTKSPISSRIKINHKISKKHNFKLFAVVMHSGETLNSGHYTAFVNYKIFSGKNSKIFSEDSKPEIEWLHFDDTKVKSLTNLEFQHKIVDSSFDSPYILFYVKE